MALIERLDPERRAGEHDHRPEHGEMEGIAGS